MRTCPVGRNYTVKRERRSHSTFLQLPKTDLSWQSPKHSDTLAYYICTRVPLVRCVQASRSNNYTPYIKRLYQAAMRTCPVGRNYTVKRERRSHSTFLPDTLAYYICTRVPLVRCVQASRSNNYTNICDGYVTGLYTSNKRDACTYVVCKRVGMLRRLPASANGSLEL
jgi:hypothetical protein